MIAVRAVAGGARFQSFQMLGGPEHGAERIARLRSELGRFAIDGFVVPRADRHQNEYVAPSDERLLWLTGFSGSAGLAIVFDDKAALFVDGRYTAQAPAQVDISVFAVAPIATTTPSGWIEANVKKGGRIGYDPWLLTTETVDRLRRAAEKRGAELVALATNPIDAIWSDRPSEPSGPVKIYPLRLSGERTVSKIERVRATLEGVDGLLVSDPHCVAWLFNIRGSDVSHTPLPLSFAYVPRLGRPTLFVDGRKLSNSVRENVSARAHVVEPACLEATIESLGRQGLKVVLDKTTAPAKLGDILVSAGGEAVLGADPIGLMKARKNAVELAGARSAQLRDGVAVTRFLAWVDREATKGSVTEIDAANALEAFRRETGSLKDISFPTIAATGPHAAIPHYRVSEASNIPIAKGLFLIDSGGQYEDGTTDITRTVAVGPTTQTMRDRFTRVLKGHIAIARTVFPKGTTGAQIDAFARRALWEAGLDFDHGTGHGIGAYLSVHEGPQRIAKTGTVALEAGMILSNEPGYYASGQFGIRIENLVIVEPRRIAGGDREMLAFETITLAPIDRRAIEVGMLDATERKWIDEYHSRVRKTLTPLLDRPSAAWLAQATRKLSAKR